MELVQDVAGLLLLLAYLAVRLGEGFLLSPRFFDWPYVSNAAALMAVGLLLGRFLGMFKVIARTLSGGEGDVM